MKLIFDSAPLIYFGKIRLLEKLHKLKHTCIIPKTVYQEVVETGLERGFEDAAYVKGLVGSGLFSVETAKHMINIKGIEKADSETLALAKELMGTIITDDQKVRNMASVENIDNAGSVFIIFLLIRKNIISAKEARIYIDKMIENGWYCSTDFYSEIINKLSSL